MIERWFPSRGQNTLHPCGIYNPCLMLNARKVNIAHAVLYNKDEGRGGSRTSFLPEPHLRQLPPLSRFPCLTDTWIESYIKVFPQGQTYTN